MQCRDAQFYLRLRRHTADELGADVAGDLDRHLTGCPGCAADARAAETFDRAVAVAVRSVPVPAGLREKLLTQASVHHGAVIRRQAYRVAALAGCLFLAVGLGFGVFSAGRPKLDTATLVLESDDQIRDPDAALRRWLTAQKFPAELPVPRDETDPFDTDLLMSLSVERLQGKDAPVVVFRHPAGRGFAKVYLFHTPGEFDLKSVQDAQGSQTLARVINDQTRYRGVVYVIVSTGPSLKPFLRPQAAGNPPA